jgi:hypothetical protein
MSNNILALIRRPTIEFNPARAEHRYWYYQFRTTGSWGKCPYSWYCPADFSSVPGYIEYALSEWYMRVDGPAKKRPNYKDGLLIPVVDVKTARTRVYDMIGAASE